MPYSIMLDAGHGGADPGAVYDGRLEKDDALELALAVGKILQEGGIDVSYTRTTDIYQTPFEKAQLANRAGVDYFISIHRNSSPEPNQYQGVETLVYDKSGMKLTMAEAINGALEELGFRNLGVKARPGLVVLRRTRMPALLIEAGFLNNDSDNDLFDEQKDEIARAIANAILGTLDMETVESESSSDGTGGPPSGPSAPSGPDSSGPGSSMPDSSAPDSSEPSAPSVPPTPSVPPVSEIPEEGDPNETYYRVQVGVFRVRQNADNLLYELLDQGYPAFILYDDGYYKVQVGAYRILGNAIIMERRLRRAGYSTLITT